jgi:hypothetical protein
MAPAHADAFWRWLDELSGPGKFHGADIDIRIACWSKEPPAGQYDSQLLKELERIEKAKSNDKVVRMSGVGVQTPCLIYGQKLKERRKSSFNVSAGYQLAQQKHLVYADPERERSIFLVSARPMYWWRLARSVEFGLGGGAYWFKTTGEDGFWKFTPEAQLDIKPLALIRDLSTCDPHHGIPDSQFDQLISVRLGLLTFPGGFNASQFGATKFKNGKTEVDAEAMWSLSILVDLEPAFRMKKAAQALEEILKTQPVKKK